MRTLLPLQPTLVCAAQPVPALLVHATVAQCGCRCTAQLLHDAVQIKHGRRNQPVAAAAAYKAELVSPARITMMISGPLHKKTHAPEHMQKLQPKSAAPINNLQPTTFPPDVALQGFKTAGHPRCCWCLLPDGGDSCTCSCRCSCC